MPCAWHRNRVAASNCGHPTFRDRGVHAQNHTLGAGIFNISAEFRGGSCKIHPAGRISWVDAACADSVSAIAYNGCGGFLFTMWTLGPEEMVAIFIVALLLFGPKELPKLGKTIGKAMTEFRRAQTELKSTFDREMRNLERETGIKELTATNFGTDSYNYDHSSYDSSYYDGSYNSTPTTTSANGASATQGAGSTATLQIEAAAGSIASGHMDSEPQESSWDPWVPAATSVPAENGHSATTNPGANPGHPAASVEKNA
jgi:sec-independent protein translocase protein TatA